MPWHPRSAAAWAASRSPVCRSARSSAAPEADEATRAADYRGQRGAALDTAATAAATSPASMSPSRQRTKAFYHFTVGGDLEVEDEEVLSREVDEVVCRWCGHGRSVVEIADEEQPGARRVTDRRRPTSCAGCAPSRPRRDRPPLARDIVGVTPDGAPCRVEVMEAAAPVSAPVPLGGLPRLPGPVGRPRPAAGGSR